MSHLYFSQPEWLFALLLAPALWLLRHRTLLWPFITPPLRMRYPLLKALQEERQSQQVQPANTVRLPLLGITLVLFVIALAQPVKPLPAAPQSHRPQAVDLILVANTSVSMALKDSSIEGHQSDRMHKQIDSLSKLVQRFRGERIALVVLGRPPALWLPLTHDRKLVLSMLSRLQTTLGGRNSDIGASLQLVAEKIPPDRTADANKKIIVLSTDAYQQLGAQAAQPVAARLAQQGYQLHTLAIGSTRFAESLLGKAHLIYQPVDLAFLQQLADSGNGKMFRASKQNVLAELLAALDRKQPAADSQAPQRFSSLYSYPLLVGLLLIFWQLFAHPFAGRSRDR